VGGQNEYSITLSAVSTLFASFATGLLSPAGRVLLNSYKHAWIESKSVFFTRRAEQERKLLLLSVQWLDPTGWATLI
jgi:hypothetical protein